MIPMNRFILLLSLVALFSLPSRAAISGTVTDSAGNGISGVGVSLVGGGTSTTTGASGAWSLSPIGVAPRPARMGHSVWTGKSLDLTLTEPSTVSVDVYNLKGAVQGRLSSMDLEAGSHSLPLSLPGMGLVWLRVTVNGKSETIIGGIGGSAIRGRTLHESSVRSGAPIANAARSQVVLDTLRFSRNMKVVARIPLSSLDTSGIVTRIDIVSGIGWNESIGYGSVTHAGQTYKTVKIGTQTWMAENLNVKSTGTDSGVYAYPNNPEWAKNYGRMYTWASLMGLADSCNTVSCASQVQPKHQGICPTGWHVPSDADWDTLVAAAGGSDSASDRLKSMVGWDVRSNNTDNGIDAYGFRALPGGSGSGGSLREVGLSGEWWSATEVATEVRTSHAYFLGLPGHLRAYKGWLNKSDSRSSARCLRAWEDATVFDSSAALTSLSVDSGSFKSGFTPATLVYTDSVSASLGSLTVTATPSSPHATITYNGSTGNVVTLAGVYWVDVKVTNGTGSNVYRIIIVRERKVLDIPWNETKTYGNLTYANQTYKTVKIGTQTWMAENLNVKSTGTDSGQYYYPNNPDSAKKYGRLYTWASLMGLADSCNTLSCASQVQLKHQGICPTGWHVPSYADWDTLMNAVGGSGVAGIELKSTAGWNRPGNDGTDTYGFRALPGGVVGGGSSGTIGNFGGWWSATESTIGDYAASPFMFYTSAEVNRMSNGKTHGFSARCLED